MTKKQQQQENILRHGFKLQRIFPATKELGPVQLCKKLRRIEVAAHRDAERLCNGEIEPDESDRRDERYLKRIKAILGNTDAPIFIDGDRRGYALKIDDKYVRENNLDIYKDWGGYGILAPEF